MNSPATSGFETEKHQTVSFKAVVLAVVAVVWLGSLVLGLTLLSRYKHSPGTAAHPPALWPSASRIRPTTDRATLVMLAHPHCPCTRAAIGELALLMAKSQGRVNATVLFTKPSGKPNKWESTDLWRSASEIPGVNVVGDDRGVEAAHFRASTSSQVVLYDVAGRLIFHGGITGSRGHSGDNIGRSAIASLLTEGTAERDQSAVYGCPLNERAAECDQEKGVPADVVPGN
jgi:hypothetical protein